MSAKEIDISGLVLTGFGIFKKKVNTDGNTDHPEADGPQPLAPIQGTANGDLQPTKMTYLKEVIELMHKHLVIYQAVKNRYFISIICSLS